MTNYYSYTETVTHFTPKTENPKPSTSPDSTKSTSSKNTQDQKGTPDPKVSADEKEVSTEDSSAVTEAPVENETPRSEPSVPEEPENDVVSDLRSDLQRLQAEYVNYRKRVERDRDVAREVAMNSTFKSLLPVLDDMDAARKHGDLENAGAPAAILNKLDGILATLGLERIDEVGVPFNPTIHEAMLVQPHPEVPSEHVSQVFRNGYSSGDRIIRAAQVMISSGN